MIGSWEVSSSPALASLAEQNVIVFTRSDCVLSVWSFDTGERQRLEFDAEILALDCDHERLLIGLSSNRCILFKKNTNGIFVEERAYPISEDRSIISVVLGPESSFYYATSSDIYFGNDVIYSGSICGRIAPSPDHRWVAFRSDSSDSFLVHRNGFNQTLAQGQGSVRFHNYLSTTLILLVCNRVATIWVEINDRFVSALKKRDVCSIAPLVEDTSYFWMAHIDHDGCFVITAVDGLCLRPRPIVISLEYFRISLYVQMPTCTTFTLFSVVALFTSESSWESPPGAEVSSKHEYAPDVCQLVAMDQQNTICCCLISIPECTVSDADFYGGHSSSVRALKFSPCSPFVASIDSHGTLRLFSFSQTHPLSGLERDLRSELLNCLRTFPGSFLECHWHSTTSSLFAVKQVSEVITFCVISMSNGLASWTISEIAELPKDSMYFQIATKPLIGIDVIIAATTRKSTYLYRTEDLNRVIDVCSVGIETNFNDIQCFAMGAYEYGNGSEWDKVTMGMFYGFKNGLLVHRVMDIGPGSCVSIRHETHFSHSVREPVSSISFFPECHRAVTHAGNEGAVWEISPTLNFLNCIHMCPMPRPISACSLGDGFIRVVTMSLSNSLLTMSLFKPNRDRLLREHEFCYIRWQRDDLGFQLPSGVADSEITALSVSPFGDVLVAVGRVTLFISSCHSLTKDLSTIVLPVQPYHPSFLTELLMTGHIKLASTIISLVCKSAGSIPSIPFPLLLGYDKSFQTFTSDDVSSLTRVLTERLLPFLTSPENIQLLAVAHTILELNEISRSDIDLPGFRFLIAARLFQFECRSHQTCQQRLEWVDVAWAIHSGCKASLAKLSLPCEIVDWKTLSALGVGYWLDSPDELRKVIETLAKAQFLKNRSALAVMPWYLALQKKSVFLGLLKSSVKQRSMYSFFANDFSDPRWETAAVKNAFEFISNRKFLSAIAMFLLAGRLSDAVTVCLRNMNDAQLAAVLVRLQPNAPSELISEIFEDVLANANASHDQWLQHIAFWNLNRHQDAINCLLDQDPEAHTFKPDVYNLLSTLNSLPADSDCIIANTVTFYAQRGWTVLSLRLLESLRVSTPRTFREFLIRATISVRASCGSAAIADDIQQSTAPFDIDPESIRQPLHTFLQSHRLFLPSLQLLRNAYGTLIYSINPSRIATAYRRRLELISFCSLCQSHEKSAFTDSILLAASYIMGRYDAALMVELLQGKFPLSITEDYPRPQTLEASLKCPKPIELPPSFIESPFSDKEIVSVVESLCEVLSLFKFLQLFNAQCLSSPRGTEYSLIFELYSKLLSLLKFSKKTLQNRVKMALEYCLILTRSGIKLADASLPLRSLGTYSESVQALLSLTDARRVLSVIADNFEDCCSLSVNGEFLEPVEIFRASSSAILSISLDQTEQMRLVIAHRKFIREINIESSLRFRIRTQESRELADYEYSSWEGCYHRFDKELERLSTPLDPYIYPVPVFRAELASTLPSQEPDSSKTLKNRLTNEDPLYQRLMNYNISYKSSPSVNTEMTFQRTAPHPSLPLCNDSQLIHIWKFGNPFPIGHISAPELDHFTCLRFDETTRGACFAATSANGHMSVFTFFPDVSVPLFSVRAHHRTLAAEFIGCATKLATGGAAGQKKDSDILLWDLLCPGTSPVLSFSGRHKARRAYTSLSFIEGRNQLVAGSLSGDLCAFDLRALRPQSDPFWQFDNAHTSRLKCMAYDKANDYLVTGDADGCIRIWSIRGEIELVHDCGVVFPTQRSFGQLPSTPGSNTRLTEKLGVTSLRVTDRGDIVCAGSNGSVKYIKKLQL